ncbi:MAG TPA: hypothetical protein GXZ23_06380 [Clostridiales bacterium]|nr:hypothetical protein [Clostridiales bacterium]
MINKRLKIGFNTNDLRVLSKDEEFAVIATAAKDLDFIVCHTDNITDLDTAIKRAKEIAEITDKYKLKFVANFEWQNFNHGKDLTGSYLNVNHADGTHRLEVHPDFVKALNSKNTLIGLMYDEFEHTIINRNISIAMESRFKTDLPVFPVPDTKDPIEQGEILETQLNEYIENAKVKHGDMLFLGEHVFPVLYHKFATSGITPNFKSQKEGISNIQFSIAAGATLQYNKPLFNCVDMWFMLKHPGHDANEMYNNLKFAYYAGVNYVYVETSNPFFDKTGETKHLNENGRAFIRFANEYANNERDYDIQDYHPEIAIIRMDDTYWGQGSVPLPWRNNLFGNDKVKPDYKAKEWLEVFHLLSHGEVPKSSFTWNRINIQALRKHHSFCTLNSTVVFDDKVKKEQLESVKLAFLCGYRISADTLKAVTEMVKDKGMVVVTSKRFAPDYILSQVKGKYCEIIDGKGKWIITDSFSSNKLKKALETYLGKKGEIRLTFKDREIKFNISKDKNSITIISGDTQ